MLLDIDKLREANVHDLEEVEMDVLVKVFKVTELDDSQKIEIDHLYKICDSILEYIQTKDHNVNFVSYVNEDLEGIIVSRGGFEHGCYDHEYFIQQNESGYTYEEMKEILLRRINQMYDGFLYVQS